MAKNAHIGGFAQITYAEYTGKRVKTENVSINGYSLKLNVYERDVLFSQLEANGTDHLTLMGDQYQEMSYLELKSHFA